MKKNELAAKKLKKLRLSRETLHTLTSLDARNVVGGIEYGTSPRPTGCLASEEEACGTT